MPVRIGYSAARTGHVRQDIRRNLPTVVRHADKQRYPTLPKGVDVAHSLRLGKILAA
jgi:hypothetical protein